MSIFRGWLGVGEVVALGWRCRFWPLFKVVGELEGGAAFLPPPPSLNHSWLLLARVITFFFAFSEGSELFHSSASGDPGKHRGRQEEEKGGCAWCGVVLCVLGSRLA